MRDSPTTSTSRCSRTGRRSCATGSASSRADDAARRPIRTARAASATRRDALRGLEPAQVRDAERARAAASSTRSSPTARPGPPAGRRRARRPRPGASRKLVAGSPPPCSATLGSMNARSSHGAPTLACGQSMSQTRCWWSGSIITLSARRSPCTSASPGAHPQRRPAPSGPAARRCSQRPPADVAGQLGVARPRRRVVERVQLAPAGEVVGQLVVRAGQRVPGQRLGVCERSQRRRRRARRSSGFHGSSGERPCTTSKPRMHPVVVVGRPQQARRGHLRRAARAATRISARARSGETRVLLGGDRLDEDAAAVGELEHGGEPGAEPAGRADLGGHLGARPARRSGPARAAGGRASPAAGR